MTTQERVHLPALAGVAPVTRRYAWRALVVALTVALLATVAWRATRPAGAGSAAAPQNGRMENSLGVRFTRADVVGGAGIIELRYVVLDPVKAQRFQSDTYHPPHLRDEVRGQAVSSRTALMKQGHQLRAGQQYYLLYLNNRAGVRSGDRLEIRTAHDLLRHFPVR